LVLRFVDATGPVPALQAVLPMAVGSLLLLLALSLVTHRSRLALASGGLLVIGVVGAAPWLWPREFPEPSTADTVVLAANLEFGQGDLSEVVDLVRHHDVDALVLLEATSRTAEQVTEGPLADLLPHLSGQVRDDAGGTLVLTADPHLELADPPEGTFTQVAVRVQGSGGDWTLLAVHPAPPLLTTSERWRTDLAALQAWVEGRGEERLVLTGDFNASQGHPAFRALADGMVDAHREVGAGWVRTWPMESTVPPFIQLDHILVRGFEVHDAGVANVRGSDHRAVWARLG
ncbi:MAG: endonuclease/exonuclease/phosphatase family protein, partial [Actinomycetales bacterium]|nr:endonuclease/exonuclease/phosphatase family protein [Actinomycetales bacterium]